MIIINNQSYKNNKGNITFGNYNVTRNRKTKKGVSPFISFKCKNTYIGIETTYDKEQLINMQINNKADITKYISDITYEDEKGWISLICNKYNCYLKKIGNHHFIIELDCKAEEGNEIFKISINENITIEF